MWGDCDTVAAKIIVGLAQTAAPVPDELAELIERYPDRSNP